MVKEFFVTWGFYWAIPAFYGFEHFTVIFQSMRLAIKIRWKKLLAYCTSTPNLENEFTLFNYIITGHFKLIYQAIWVIWLSYFLMLQVSILSNCTYYISYIIFATNENMYYYILSLLKSKLFWLKQDFV